MRRAPDDRTLLDFGDEFLVVCPRSAGQARVRARGPAAARRTATVALPCPGCGLSQFWAASQPGLLTAGPEGRSPPMARPCACLALPPHPRSPVQ